MTLFENISRKNLIALGLFIAAKMLGIFGVLLGFVPGALHYVGLGMVVTALVLLSVSVTLCILQGREDAPAFSNEDKIRSALRQSRQESRELKIQLETLREQRGFIESHTKRQFV